MASTGLATVPLDEELEQNPWIKYKREASNPDFWKERMRSFLLGPFLIMMLNATIFTLLFNYFVYHVKYLDTKIVLILMVLTITSYVVASLFLWVGAFRKRGFDLIIGTLVLLVAFVFGAVCVTMEDLHYKPPNLDYENGRHISFGFQVFFLYAWIVVLGGSFFLATKYWSNDDPEQKPVWTVFLDTVLLPAEQDPSPYIGHIKSRGQYILAIIISAVYQAAVAAILFSWLNEYRIFDDNVWVMITAAAFFASLAGHCFAAFGVVIEDHVPLFGAASMYALSTILAVAATTILVVSWEDWHEVPAPKRQVYVWIVGASFSAAYAIFAVCIFGIFYVVNIGIALKKRPRNVSIGQAALRLRTRGEGHKPYRKF